MNKSKKLTIGLYALSIFLILGISYAYFSLNIIGNEDAKLSVISAGTLELTYIDGSDEIRLENAVPGTSFQKEITVKNTGSLDTSYNLVWNELHNTFINNEILVLAEFDILNSEGEVLVSNLPLEPTFANKNIISKNIPIESGMTHKYTFTITFVETGENQNYNQGAEFSGKISITESSTVYCTYNGELTQGAEFINGKYTYRYKQEMQASRTIEWGNMDLEGWGVSLTDKSSTEPISGNVCTYINDIPVVSMEYLFSGSKATMIDVSKFDTSMVIRMGDMFLNTYATTIKGLENFDTSNVTSMATMFYGSQATTLDLSGFDTSNITSMYGMFHSSKATVIDVSGFNTSNVTNMSLMFYQCSVTTIKGLENFDTSNVTDMRSMFDRSQATVLDLSSFDTSKVTNMYYMFNSSRNLKTIYASDKFNTDAVTDSASMFSSCTSLVGGAGTTYNGSITDKTYARIDGGTTNPGYFTLKN